jgi:hypothetical protein
MYRPSRTAPSETSSTVPVGAGRTSNGIRQRGSISGRHPVLGHEVVGLLHVQIWTWSNPTTSCPDLDPSLPASSCSSGGSRCGGGRKDQHARAAPTERRARYHATHGRSSRAVAGTGPGRPVRRAVGGRDGRADRHRRPHRRLEWAGRPPTSRRSTASCGRPRSITLPRSRTGPPGSQGASTRRRGHTPPPAARATGHCGLGFRSAGRRGR